jgi:hypothetical protein
VIKRDLPEHGVCMAVHSLNALRVMAEFVVLRGHVAIDVVSPDLVERATFAVITSHDLMTFFFVLSGYVCMHTKERLQLRFDTWAAIRAYWVNKMLRYYPIYLFALLVQHVISGAYIMLGRDVTCSWRWLCTLGDFCLLSPFLFCEGVGAAGVTWYLQTLFWLWFAFPFTSRWVTHERMWRRLLQLYALSLLGWVPGLWVRGVDLLVPWASLHRFPLLRVAEFLMGCQVFHAEAPTLRTVLSLVALYASYVLFGAFASDWYTRCTSAPVIGPCYPYGQVSERVARTCLHWWDMVHSRASLPFTALIRYVVYLEATRSPGASWLQHDIFKSLNKFSLHLYLLHQSSNGAFWFVCRYLGMDGTILLDGAILHCYLVGYLTYLYVQPVLNRLTRAALEGACCRRRGPELEEEPPSAPPSVQTLGELDVEMVDLTPTLPPWPEVGKTPHHPQVIIGGAPPPLVLTPRGYP